MCVCVCVCVCNSSQSAGVIILPIWMKCRKLTSLHVALSSPVYNCFKYFLYLNLESHHTMLWSFASTIKHNLDALICPFLPADRILSWQFFSLSTWNVWRHFLQAFMVSDEKSTVIQIFPLIRKMFVSHFQDFFLCLSFSETTLNVLASDLFVFILSETHSSFFNLYV